MLVGTCSGQDGKAVITEIRNDVLKLLNFVSTNLQTLFLQPIEHTYL